MGNSKGIGQIEFRERNTVKEKRQRREKGGTECFENGCDGGWIKNQYERNGRKKNESEIEK
jgi:hypothetical protein